MIRGPKILVPGDADGVEVTADRLESWVRNGWVDLRLANCARWLQRFTAIRESADALPDDDTSSRYLRNRDFWTEDGGRIHPGKIVGWILSVEEHGERWKR